MTHGTVCANPAWGTWFSRWAVDVYGYGTNVYVAPVPVRVEALATESHVVAYDTAA